MVWLTFEQYILICQAYQQFLHEDNYTLVLKANTKMIYFTYVGLSGSALIFCGIPNFLVPNICFWDRDCDDLYVMMRSDQELIRTQERGFEVYS